MLSDKSPPVRVLVVDDDSNIRTTISRLLETAGCEVQTAGDGERALVQAFEFQPDIILLDIIIPIQMGWLVCAKLKLVDPSPTVVLMTGLDHAELKGFSEFVRAEHVLRKPISAETVLELLPA
jgi:CheY-like chemotaxis protein